MTADSGSAPPNHHQEAEITKLRAQISQQNTTIATLYGQLEQSQT